MDAEITSLRREARIWQREAAAASVHLCRVYRRLAEATFRRPLARAVTLFRHPSKKHAASMTGMVGLHERAIRGCDTAQVRHWKIRAIFGQKAADVKAVLPHA
jgi:hypothetical protein